MERQVAKSFNSKVDKLIDDEAERDEFYAILGDYQRSRDLGRLILDLRNVINCPVRMSLYDNIRRLISPKHQMDYDVLVPRYEVDKTRTVRLKRRNNEGIGFAVRGGLEHGIGLFVSHVVPDSQAQRQGLRVGDEIVRINGFTVRQAIHQEALGLVKTRRDIVMKVRNVGLLPVKEHPDDKLKWKYIENTDTEKALQEVLAGHSPSELREVGTIVKLYVSITGGSGLGCSICSGPAHHPGIFIQSIKSGSLAQKAGLVVGDQILSVNDTSFINVKHSEAVVALKSSRQLNMVLKRGAGLSLFGASGSLKTAEDVKAEQLREDAVVRDRVMEAAEMMGDGHEITGRQVSIHIEDAQTRKQPPPPPPPPPFVSQSSTLSSSASNCSPPPLVSSHSAVLAAESISQIHSQGYRKNQQQTKQSQGEEPVLHRRKLQEKEELERLKREYLQKEGGLSPSTKQPSTSPLNVVTDGPTAHRHSSSLSPSYRQEKPTFRFQKPVLLSPVRLDDRSPTPSNTHSSSTVPDKTTVKEEFNPAHLFTNEQIAGRQVKLVNILKNEHQELGIKLEEGRGANQGKVLIGEVRKNSAAYKQGGLDAGDQVMMVCGVPVVNYSFDHVVSIIDSLGTAKESIQLVVAKAPAHHMEEEITYF